MTSKVVYLTRLRLRSRLMIPRFFFANIPITLQLMRAPGFLGGASVMESHAVFWTMSLWESEAAMRAFKTSGAHGRVMPKNVDWSIESAGAGWSRDTLPSWEEAHAHLVAHGHATPVRKPTPDHATRNYAAAAAAQVCVSEIAQLSFSHSRRAERGLESRATSSSFAPGFRIALRASGMTEVGGV